MSGQMNSTPLFRSTTRALIALATALMTNACHAESEIVDHSFEFDALHDSPGVEIVDFRYGDTKFPGARNPEYLIHEGRPLQRTAISGPMKRPKDLYVKWRVLNENKTYEETVDLRKRLPKQIGNTTVYFLVQGTQLYVYLILNERRTPSTPPNGPRAYRNRKVLTIYPDAKS